MSALDELKEIKKSHRIDLDWAVIDYDTERAAAELLALRERVAEQDKQLTWWLETYDITMPCGHKNRYLLTDGRGELVKDNRGDCVCVMCQLEVADEIDAALKSQ